MDTKNISRESSAAGEGEFKQNRGQRGELIVSEIKSAVFLALVGFLILGVSGAVYAALPPWVYEEPCKKSCGTWISDTYACTCPEGTANYCNTCYTKTPQQVCEENGGTFVSVVGGGWAGPCGGDMGWVKGGGVIDINGTPCNDFCTCNSCSDCSDKLNDPLCSVVK